MQINNPLQMNDWEIKKFLKVVLAIQLAVWGVIGLDTIGLHIPVIREFISFIYLFFIPGIIILRVLRLHKLGNIETLLYSVGLSIATLMFTGLFMNTVYPLFGISDPISTTPLIITISAVVLILCIVSYVRDKDFSDPNYIDIKGALSPPALFLYLIPFVSIFGTYLVNFHQTNILLMFLIAMIALTVLLIGFDKFIPKNLYPLAVFVITLSLLFYRSLISMYISGYDIHHEYQVSNLIITNAIWDSTTPGMLNTMLSITVLAPISSLVSGMSLTWIFKIIYPLLFSLASLGLYRVFQKQTGDKIAFLSCFFFVSLVRFYHDLAVMPRQLSATLFLALLILLMIDKRMSKIKRSFLFIAFSASLVVSHYGLSYIYMFGLIFAWLILVLAENPEMKKLKSSFYSKFSRYKGEKPAGNPISSSAGRGTISPTFVLLFIVFALAWYMYISMSTVFDAYVRIVSHMISTISMDFLNPEVAERVQWLVTKTPLVGLLHGVHIIIYYLSQTFIIIGVLVLLKKHRELKFEKEYVAFSMLNLVIFFAVIAPPFLSPLLLISGADTGRLYHIALIFLAPFCVIGGLTVLRMISRVVKASWKNERVRKSLKVSALSVLSVYFVIFFLFQTGFVWQVTQSYPGSILLGQEWIKEYGDAEVKARLYNAVTLEQDVFSARWLSVNRNSKELIYATYDDIRVHALTSYGMIPVEDVPTLASTTKTIPKDAYVYLQYINVIEGIGTEVNPRSYYNMTEISHLFAGKNKIYSNGGSEIYK